MRSAGIDPATGQEIFINKNGEYTFKYDAEDEVVVGNTQPKLQGTWLNTLRYKGWSLNFVFSYTFGGDTYNKTLWEKVEDIDPRYNVDERAFTDRWKNPGDLSRYLAIKERRSTTPAQLGAFRGAAQRTVAFERDAHLRVPAEIPQTARIQAPGRRCRRIGHRTLLDRQVRTRYELPLLPHHQPDIPSHVLILPRP